MSLPTLEGEQSYLVQRYALTAAQYATIAATPLYAISALRRGTFSIRSLVRYNFGVPLIGAGAGVAAGYARTSTESGASIASRSVDMRMDKTQVRRDDHFLVGAVVGGLLVPALFLRRAGLINGVLGGAGLGGATGLITSYIQEPGNISEKLSREGHRAMDTGRNLAHLAQDKGEALAHRGEQAAHDAREKGREAVDRAKQ